MREADAGGDAPGRSTRGTVRPQADPDQLSGFVVILRARKFRRHLSENAYKPGAGIEVLEQGLALIKQETERAEAQAAAGTTAQAAERTAL